MIPSPTPIPPQIGAISAKQNLAISGTSVNSSPAQFKAFTQKAFTHSHKVPLEKASEMNPQIIKTKNTITAVRNARNAKIIARNAGENATAKAIIVKIENASAA